MALAWKVFVFAGMLALLGGLDWTLRRIADPESNEYTDRLFTLRGRIGRAVFLVAAPVAVTSFLDWLAGNLT